MKKYNILTMCFLLIACASGGNNTINNTKHKVLTTKQSNEIITGIEGKDSNSDEISLESVRFTSSDSIIENQNNYISFKLNKNGKIEELKAVDSDGTEINSGMDSDILNSSKRIKDSNIFISTLSVFEFLPAESGIDLIKNESVTYAYTLEKLKEELKKKVENKNPTEQEKKDAFDKIEALTSESLGIKKDKKHKLKIEQEMYGKYVGLKYSDFGFLNREFKEQKDNGDSEIIDNKSGLTLIAGGFQERNIDKAIIQEKVVFNGKAVGVIKNKNFADGNLNLVDGKTELTFDPSNSSEKLKISFSNWYDLEVNKDSLNSKTIKFTNSKGNQIDSKFQLDENVPDNIEKFETKYYGINGTVLESVGYLEYKKESAGTEKILKISFGAKK